MRRASRRPAAETATRASRSAVRARTPTAFARRLGRTAAVRPTPRSDRPGSRKRYRPGELLGRLQSTIAVDFLTVPTVMFDALYVFVVLSLERRRVLHVNVTSHPHAGWAAALGGSFARRNPEGREYA